MIIGVVGKAIKKMDRKTEKTIGAGLVIGGFIFLAQTYANFVNYLFINNSQGFIWSFGAGLVVSVGLIIIGFGLIKT